MAPPTILSQKQDFLTAQTLQLSQPLAPSRAWTRGNEQSDHALVEKAVDEALYRLNHTLQQHAKRAYAPQATRHVAEQIETLYLSTGNRPGEDDEGLLEADGDLLRTGADLGKNETIAALPATWDQHSSEEALVYPSEARRYAELAAQLASSAERRKALRERVQRLKSINDRVAPFREGVQENLVTRNGDVEKELEKMRMLLVRVAGRLGQVPIGRGGTTEADEGLGEVAMEDLDVVEKKKVSNLLDGL